MIVSISGNSADIQRRKEHGNNFDAPTREM
jgi:hypothetical protein